MITDAEFLTLHHQRSAELQARATAYRLARATASPAPRRIRWPRLARRRHTGAPVRPALR